jgi:hypothetical protein
MRLELGKWFISFDMSGEELVGFGLSTFLAVFIYAMVMCVRW